MLDAYFVFPSTIRRFREGPSGPYVDGFAEELERRGYSPSTAVKYLRSAAHLGRFIQLRGVALTAVTAGTVASYRRHLRYCRCPRPYSGRKHLHAFFGAKLFVEHLRRAGVVAEVVKEEAPVAPLVGSFGDWLEQHRGISLSVRRQRCLRVAHALKVLGEDPRCYDARSIRGYFVECLPALTSRSSAQALAASLRAFLRFLVAQGLCPVGLDQAVPALAAWRLAALPRCLSASEVARLLAACDGNSFERVRDRAALLLLVRLALRAGEVAELRLSDIDWGDGSLVVSGKSRREVRLPLPQEVGDALLTYLERRPAAATDRVFLRVLAPIGPLRGGDAVSGVVKRAMCRARLTSPSPGAHVLRHTAAREMLRQGVPLYEIGALLRHRSVETTAFHYAKVDVALLRKVAQRWPSVLQ